MLFLLFAVGLPTPGVAQPGVAQHLSAHFCKPNQIGGQASIITGEYQNQGPLLAVENMILTCPIITITAAPSAAFNVTVMYDSSAVTEAKPIVCKLSRLKSVGSTVGDEVAGFPGVPFGPVDLHIDQESSNDGVALNVECSVSKGLKVLSYILRQL
jgi:hypothetical protein